MKQGGNSMTDDGKVIEHIKLIQPIISRMSSSSFAIKGFALTTQSLLIGFSLKDSIWQLNILLQIIITVLCMIDMFYLWQERLYRFLYDKVRLSEKTDFSMNTKEFKTYIKYFVTFKSVAIWPFYIGLLIINIVSIIWEITRCTN
jgi:hypothetical protein